MPLCKTYVPIAISCLALLLSCLPSSAQTPPISTTQTSPVTIKSTVNVVLVPVLVLDSQGHAVGNLTKDDFQVSDRDKPQSITGFSSFVVVMTAPPGS